MIVFGSFVLICGFYLVYNYLYKQKRYKVYANVGIYVSSIACIALNIAYAAYVPFTDYCNLTWFFTSYTAAYFYLVIVIC